MGTVEQNDIRIEYYNEAIRYMDNAKETLKKAGNEDAAIQREHYFDVCFN